MSWKTDYGSPDPQEAEGGIKPHGAYGRSANNWWTERWMQVLGHLFPDKRLTRGRRYAREGRVMSLEVDMGIVTAEVQGGRPDPYYATLEVPLIGEEIWRDITRMFSRRSACTAHLLAGRMPEEVGECFDAVNASLFPDNQDDLKAHCACSDSIDLCKHLAAVCHLLGEQFGRDPFLMFKLRGMERGELMAELNPKLNLPPENKPSNTEDVPAHPTDFWTTFDADELQPPGANIPKRPAQLPNRLGPFPFWRSEVNFLRKLEIIYENAAGHGLRVATTESESSPDQA